MLNLSKVSGGSRLLITGLVLGLGLTAFSGTAQATPNRHVCRFAPQLCEDPAGPRRPDRPGGESPGNGPRRTPGQAGVPELGPAGLGGSLVLLAGGLAVMNGRRRRLSLAGA